MEVIENPFSWIARRFNHIEKLLLEAKKAAPATSAPPEDKPLTRAQAAEFLQVTPPTLDAWVKAGLVHRRTVGNEIRFLPSDLLASLRKPEISRVQSRKNKKA